MVLLLVSPRAPATGKGGPALLNQKFFLKNHVFTREVNVIQKFRTSVIVYKVSLSDVSLSKNLVRDITTKTETHQDLFTVFAVINCRVLSF